MAHRMSGATTNTLIEDYRTVVADAEDLLRATANQAGEKAVVARAKIEKNLARAREMLADAEGVAVDTANDAIRVTDNYVHRHPWESIGVAAGAGLIIGWLVSRR
ncbi:MAG TPA: DUF883 family protein [Burkholderiales bacterium]|nr:DUF883 family protein [Burkholderiales bacterium]